MPRDVRVGHEVSATQQRTRSPELDEVAARTREHARRWRSEVQTHSESRRNDFEQLPSAALHPCAAAATAARALCCPPRIIIADVVQSRFDDGSAPVEAEIAVALRLELLPVEPGQLAIVAVPVVVPAARVRVFVACDPVTGITLA